MTETVLLIDSDPEIKKLVAEALSRMRLVFATGAGMLEQALSEQPEVVVMDAQLPAATGDEILRRLRRDREMRDVPVVIVSGHGSHEIAEADVVVSPFDADQLREVIGTAIESHRMRRAVHQAVEEVMDASRGSAADLTESELAVLRRGGFDPERAPNAAPVARHAARYQALLAASLSVAKAAERLGVTPGRVRQRLKDGSLYGIRRGGAWRLPAFQFLEQDLVPNIGRVLARLDRGLDPVTVESWFRRPSVDLEIGEHRVSPLDWLAQGRPWEPVAELAEDL